MPCQTGYCGSPRMYAARPNDVVGLPESLLDRFCPRVVEDGGRSNWYRYARCRALPPSSDGCSHSISRSEEHTSELQSLMRISYAVFCLQKNTTTTPYCLLPHT